MAIYKNIKDLDKYLKDTNKSTIDIKLHKEWINLLELLEKINYCNQRYEVIDNCMVVSYKLRLNIFNFKDVFPLNLNVEIIGLPISISHRGYFGDISKVKKIVEKRKGLKIILNSDHMVEKSGLTLSSFIFYNRFKSFDDYLNSLRSSYRRRIKKAISNRKRLDIRQLDRKDFNKEHYKLYLSIMERADNPLETLPIEFFKEYEGQLYEFIDKKINILVGFIQVKEIDEKLLFLFGGFYKKDNRSYDLYYNMLLTIVQLGIKRNVKLIEFGQTAEESKLKIGCIEKKKYLYVHHSNPILNKCIQILLPFFSYKPYNIKHNVFKEEDNLKVEE